MLPVVSEVSFFGAEHRPGRFSSRVSNFDIELYIHQYSQYLNKVGAASVPIPGRFLAAIAAL